MTALFAKTEVRGEDASGFWGAADTRTVLYHKEPVKSSEFVQKEIWKKVSEENPDLLLCHARAASIGVGVPAVNKNNHPFISADKRLGLVHNGRIPDVEYKALRKKYPTLSGTDSELLLRIFEAGKYASDDRMKEFETFDQEVRGRLVGMKDIWSFLSLGHMAVAIGETQNDTRRLWLFRNKHRTLWLCDLRLTLGQVFFFSVPMIWRDATRDLDIIKPYLTGGGKLIEIPTEEIWMFTYGPDCPLTARRSLKRFEVCSSGSYEAWKEETVVPQVPAGIDHSDVRMVTGLLEEDKLPEPPKREIGFHTNVSTGAGAGRHNGAASRDNSFRTFTKPVSNLKTSSSSFPVGPEDIDSESIVRLCESIREIATSIETVFNNQLAEGSVSQADFQDLKLGLEQTELDMNGTLKIMER